MQGLCLLEEALRNSSYDFYCGNNCMNIQGPTCLLPVLPTCNNILESVTSLCSCNDYINYFKIGIIFNGFRYLEKNRGSKLRELKLMCVLYTSIAARAAASWLSH